MKRISLMLVLLAVGCILLSQGGCGEAKKSPQKSEPVVQAPEETAIAVAQKPPEPTKPEPKPAPDKPKPVAVRPKPVVAKKPKPAAKVDPNAPAARIKFDKTTHDFGNMDPDSSNICEFPFKNVGEEMWRAASS